MRWIFTYSMAKKKFQNSINENSKCEGKNISTGLQFLLLMKAFEKKQTKKMKKASLRFKTC